MKSSNMLLDTIVGEAEQLKNQQRMFFDDAMAELIKIEYLYPNDVDLAYDWLLGYKEKQHRLRVSIGIYILWWIIDWCESEHIEEHGQIV